MLKVSCFDKNTNEKRELEFNCDPNSIDYLLGQYLFYTFFYSVLHPFNFNGVELFQYFHSYNCWGYKSRTIEIPIIRWYLNNKKHERCLEIGNVTKHYYDLFRDVPRDVVDRDEKAYDVINKDIYDYKTKDKYDFIYSISTFEHMPEDVRLRNLNHVYNNLLAKNGIFILTFPIDDGEDRISIDYLAKIRKTFNNKRVFFYKSIDEQGMKNKWIECLIPKNGHICIMEVRK